MHSGDRPANSVRPLPSERAALSLIMRFSRWSRPKGATITILLIVAVTVAAALTDRDVVVALLYVAPVALAALGRGWRIGAFVAVGCAILGGVVDHQFRQTAEIPFAIQLWNWCLRGAVFVSSAWLVGALRNRLRREVELARTDPLTALSNRLAFFEAVELELARTKRTGKPLSLAYIDLDHFKRVNDELGHQEGDRVLLAAAQAMRSAFRQTDVVARLDETAARLGGDEFSLLMPETSAEGAVHAIERLREEWDKVSKKSLWPVTFSIGLVTVNGGNSTVDVVIREADALMYEAKRSGGDGVRRVELPAAGDALTGSR